MTSCSAPEIRLREGSPLTGPSRVKETVIRIERSSGRLMRGASQQALIWVAMALPTAAARSPSRPPPVPCVLAPSARVPVPVSSEKEALLGCGGETSTGWSCAGVSFGTYDHGSEHRQTGGV